MSEATRTESAAKKIWTIAERTDNYSLYYSRKIQRGAYMIHFYVDFDNFINVIQVRLCNRLKANNRKFLRKKHFLTLTESKTITFTIQTFV